MIRRVRGKLYFMFQLCELRKHQLVEAHVRLYVFRDRYLEQMRSRVVQVFILIGQNMTALEKVPVNQPVHFQTTHCASITLMMISGACCLCVYHNLSTEIDASSGLMPPPRWQETLPLMENQPQSDRPSAYRYAEKTSGWRQKDFI